MPAFVGGGNTGGNGGNTNPTTAQAGQPFVYNVSFKGGTTSITSVKLTNTLPKKAKLVSVVPSQGKCKGKAPVKCDFGTVAANTSFGATFTITPKKPGVVKNKAVLTYKVSKKKPTKRLVSNLSITVN